MDYAADLTALQTELQELKTQLHQLTHDEEGNIIPRLNLIRGTAAQELRDIQAAMESVRIDIRNQQALPGPVDAAAAQAAQDARAKIPPGLPEFIRTGREATDPTRFIKKLEDKLSASAFPLSRYPAVLLAQCSDTEADYVRAHITGPNLQWRSAKEQFLAHFIGDTQQEQYKTAFETIKRRKNESIAAFADRYAETLRLAGGNTATCDRIEHLLERLPKEIRQQIRCMKHTNPESVRFIDGAIKAIVTLYPSPVNTTEDDDKDETTPRMLYCKHHGQNKSHDTAACKGKNYGKKTNQNDKDYCSHHKMKGHSTANCQALMRITSQQPAPTTQAAAQPSNRLICFTCQQPGHKSPECPRRTTVTGQTARHAREEIDPPQREEREVRFATDSYESLFEQATTQRHAANPTMDKHTIDYSTAIIIPLTINGETYRALYDTGCATSAIGTSIRDNLTKEQCETIKQPPNGSLISLAAENVFVPKLPSVVVPFNCNGKISVHRFEFCNTPPGIDAYIGRDLMTLLGIGITGLLHPTVEQQP